MSPRLTAIHTENKPGIGAVTHRQDQNESREYGLHLATLLQSTLDLEALLNLFSNEVAAVVAHDGLSYDHPQDSVSIQIGKKSRHSCSYKLVLMDEDLGELALTRGKRFSKEELQQLEGLLGMLVYPVRNALMFRRAQRTAYTDPVTGINNRSAMDNTLAHDIELARRYKQPLALLMLDVDFFKQVNDNYGHIVGDAILRQLGECIIDTVRRSDNVFRYGGEEFNVVLSNTSRDGALLLAERIRRAVAHHEFNYADQSLQITVSIGVAMLDNNEGPTDLVDKADQALYQAKNAGRNRVVA